MDQVTYRAHPRAKNQKSNLPWDIVTISLESTHHALSLGAYDKYPSKNVIVRFILISQNILFLRLGQICENGFFQL